MITSAAAITHELVDAGLDTNAIAAWWRTPRRQLMNLSPGEALRIDNSAQATILEVARADAAVSRQDALSRWQAFTDDELVDLAIALKAARISTIANRRMVAELGQVVDARDLRIAAS